jgi:hypothetical protein
MIHRFGTIALAALLLFTPLPSHASPHDGTTSGHHIKHVLTIVLENEGNDTTFGPNSSAPYLSKTPSSQGVLLNQYYGTGQVSLDNYISMISGQAATPQTRNDCQVYADFIQTGLTPDRQAIGSGRVYPASVKTLPDQLSSIGKIWKGAIWKMWATIRPNQRRRPFGFYIFFFDFNRLTASDQKTGGAANVKNMHFPPGPDRWSLLYLPK